MNRSSVLVGATQNKGEPNQYRVGNLVNVINFGVMNVGWQQPVEVLLQIRGVNNRLLQEENFIFK